MSKKLLAGVLAGAAIFTTATYAQTPEPVTYHPQIVTMIDETPTQIALDLAVEPEPEPEPEPQVNMQQARCIARAMYFEARGESVSGRRAVGYVVLNRANDRRWPSTPCRVVSQPYQFSWYGPGKTIPTKAKSYYMGLAKEVMLSYTTTTNPARKAVYFHATHVRPGWSYKAKRVAKIGRHIFYA